MEAGADRIRWMSVKNAMTKDAVSVKFSSKVKDAWLILMEADISGAPVLDDTGQLVAVVSVTDIYRAILDRYQKARSLRELTAGDADPREVEKEELRELSLAIRAVAESPLSSIIPKDQKVLSLSPDDSLERAIRLMAEHNVNRLPVVRGGTVVGIITRQDIIWVVAGRPRTER